MVIYDSPFCHSLPSSKIPDGDTSSIKMPQGDTPTTKGYHSSSSSSSSHDVPMMAVMDVNHAEAPTTSDERLNRAGSLAGDSCSYSVGVADHRLSICQSEPEVAHHRPSVTLSTYRPSVTSSTHRPSITSTSSSYFSHSQIHARSGAVSHFSHQHQQPPHSRFQQLPLSQPHPQPGDHTSLMHQHSVDQHTSHLLPLPLPTTAISCSAPMVRGGWAETVDKNQHQVWHDSGLYQRNAY